jgi:hypothetical protein
MTIEEAFKHYREVGFPHYRLGLTDSEGADLMLGKPKILLVEDELSMKCYIQMIMSRWDCELAIESTAERAIQRAATSLGPTLASSDL